MFCCLQTERQSTMFYLQFMVDIPSGLHGEPAVSPVEKASKREVVFATTPLQPMVGSLAKGQIQKCETVSVSCVQVHLFIQRTGTCSIDTHLCSLTMDCLSVNALNCKVSDSVMFHLCIVDGSWSEWSPWEECTRSCGRGNRTRTRTCNNPSAQYGGRPCEGNAIEIIMCNIRPCPGENPLMSKTWLFLTPVKRL